MVNIYSKKNNTLHYAIVLFSGLTFLASGMAIAFPSAVLSLGLLAPLIATCGTFALISLILAGQAVSKNKVISEKEAELTKKIEEVKDRNCVILDSDKQHANKIAIINDLNSQLAEKDRKLQKIEDDRFAESLFDSASDDEIYHDAESNLNAQAFTETYALPLGTTLGNGTPEESGPDTQPANGTKAAPKKIGNKWFGAKTQTFVIGAIGLLAYANLLNPISNYFTSLAHNPTGVGNAYNGYFPSASSAEHNSASFQSARSAELDRINDTLEASKKRDEQDFGAQEGAYAVNETAKMPTISQQTLPMPHLQDVDISNKTNATVLS